MALFPFQPFKIPSFLVCRDWTTTLRRASYRGVGFFVEGDSIEVGRRLVVHEFPGSDEPFIEDLGAKAKHITVTAYLTGQALGEIEVLEGGLREACELAGPGTLTIPLGQFSVHCETCRRDYAKDKQGYIAVHLKFVVDGANVQPFPLLGLARAIEFAAHAIALANAFARTFATIGHASYVSIAAAVGLQDFLAALESAARSQPIAPDVLAPMLRTTGDAFTNAATLVAIGSPGDRYTLTSYVGNSTEALDAPLADIVAGLFAALLDGLGPQDAATMCAGFIDWGITPTRITVPSTRRIAANAIAFNNLVRAAAIANYAVAVTLREYADVRDARQARADAAEFFDAALSGINGWEMFDVASQLSELRGQVAQHLSRLVATLAPIQVVSSPARMPALYWANRLYGDYSRAPELVDRNGIKHPLFMPPEFEALTR